jgi:myo-inositol-1(or 4)-monophosphatase
VIDDLTLAGLCTRRAADIVASGFGGVTDTEFKGSVDPVTAVDRAAETAIRSLLAVHRPDDSVLGEEEGGARWDGDRVWILDPLDGTVNFVHGVPHVAVSVALWDGGRPLVGVVHDVIRDEVFAASAGGGATVGSGEPGDRPLRVSTAASAAQALVATGFPYDRQERAGELAATLGRVLARVQGVRRLGSAALDLCWVAAGRYDAYWEDRLQPWDTAAGQLIVEEAGGRVSDLADEPYRPDAPAILASNGYVHDEMARILREGE